MSEKNAAAVELGKRRMSLLSLEQKKELSRLGVIARSTKGMASLTVEEKKAMSRLGVIARSKNKPRKPKSRKQK